MKFHDSPQFCIIALTYVHIPNLGFSLLGLTYTQEPFCLREGLTTQVLMLKNEVAGYSPACPI